MKLTNVKCIYNAPHLINVQFPILNKNYHLTERENYDKNHEINVFTFFETITLLNEK